MSILIYYHVAYVEDLSDCMIALCYFVIVRTDWN